MTLADYLASYPDSRSQYHVTSWSSLFSTNVEELRIDIVEIMAVQKQSIPSFASIISVLSTVFYCAGFLRVELELHKQKKRINTLERVTEAKSPSNDAKNYIIRNAPGKCVLCMYPKVYNFWYNQRIQSSELKAEINKRRKQFWVERNNKWPRCCLFCLWVADAVSELKVSRSSFVQRNATFLH